MRMYDLIAKKKNGMALSDEEIAYFVTGFSAGDIPDYQASALLMAICLRGMDARETARLTACMAESGDMADLSSIPGVKIDKHSTGGVGDKTSLLVVPIVAACGVPVAKMSGPGLGHTGGTVDKLMAIPGFRTVLSTEEFFAQVRETGCAIIGQSGDIAPADKKIYALRDVTATVDSLPLIASSIMSKKLAAGSDAILLDVKTGSGAFMKTPEDSVALAEAMVAIGERNGRRTAALVTDMDAPLGSAIGNALEVAEAAQVLQGSGPADLLDICLALAAEMLSLADGAPLAQCRVRAEQAVADGSAFQKLCDMVRTQGGDDAVLRDASLFPQAALSSVLRAGASGFVTHMDTEAVGTAAVALGAGRAKKDDAIDYAAGILLRKKTGDRVESGEPLCELFAATAERLAEAEVILAQAIAIGPAPPAPRKTILARVGKNGTEWL